jgi:DNA-binding transcriptional ArsR family regulator
MHEKEFEKVLKALANRRRLAVVTFLKHTHEAKVGDISIEIKLSFAATSRHLVILERAGILDKEQRGKEVFYRVAKPMHIFIRDLNAEL